MNVVSFFDPSDNLICKNPELALNLVKYLAPEWCQLMGVDGFHAEQSYLVWSGQHILSLYCYPLE